MLSIQNVSSPNGAIITITDSVTEDQHRILKECALAGVGFVNLRLLFVSIDTRRRIDTTELMYMVCSKTSPIRKSSCRSHGCLGRLSTAYGHFASAQDQWNPAERAEEMTQESFTVKSAKLQARIDMDELEEPLMNLLTEFGYMQSGQRLTKIRMNLFFIENIVLVKELRSSLSSTKNIMVTALLKRTELGKSRFKFPSDES